MHEIEVKALVRDVEKLEGALAEMGVYFGSPVSQHDAVYIQGDWETVQHDPNRVILRLRKEGDKSILTLKRHGINELHSIEHETGVSSLNETQAILGYIGYKLFVEVKKVRRKARFNETELCLDQVEGLGWYVEAERLVERAEAAAEIQSELFTFLESLGVLKEDQETKGYDTLIRLKNEQAARPR